MCGTPIGLPPTLMEYRRHLFDGHTAVVAAGAADDEQISALGT